MKTIILTSIPSPYRITVFDELYKELGEKFIVFYTARSHPTFNWKESKLNHVHYYINENASSDISNINGIYKKLKKVDPDVIITCGFNSVMLKAMTFAFLNKKKLIANTDAWELNEKNYSFLHILMRKIIYPFMDAFIPVSIKGFNNFRRYNIPQKKIFISHYAIDNDYSLKFSRSEKKFDLMFSGQFIDRKMPSFFCDVVELIFEKKKDLKVLLLGNGELKDTIIDRLKKKNIDFTYAGFIQKEELPSYYASSKLFLFPTKLDSWGVVSNDACAVGTPVVTCDNAGAADDLIINEFNGYVLPLNADAWAEKILELLQDPVKYNLFSENCLEQIKKYNPKEAAASMIDAINFLQK